MQPPLLVLAPLRIEVAALSGRWAATRTGRAPGFEVRRTGAGPRKAARTALALAGPGPGGPGHGRYQAVALAGLAGALSDDLAPGDLVVASRVLRSDGVEVVELPAAPLLAAELRRNGLRAVAGTIISTDHVVRGGERAKLARLGAVAVDMESAAVAAAPWGAPLAVVRAISDSPRHELLSASGPRGIALGLRSLRAARGALSRWGAVSGPREVVLAAPRSFCAGVERAVRTVERALERFGTPVYVRRQIVHNASVVSKLENAGAVFVEELSEVPDGAIVVFSAHGVGTAVYDEARRRQMFAIDATCPLVSKVHSEARRFVAAGRQVVLVGHAGHDEVEGTLGTVPGIALVTSPEDVDRLEIDLDKPTGVITQTTLAVDDVREIMGALGARLADLARPAASDICYASQNRQEAVRAIAPDCDVVLVVGSANSSNSNRLVEVARRSGRPAHLVDDKAELRLAWLEGARRVGLTAGASAPESLVQEVVQCLAGLGTISVSELSTSDEHVCFSLPVEVR